MDHPRAENLQPPAMLADAAPLALADGAAHVNFHAGLDEGEVARAKARFRFGAKEFCDELIEGGEKVGKGDVFIDIEGLELVEEDMGAGRDIFIAEGTARGGDAQRWGELLHGVDLGIARVGAEKVAGVEVKGVLHIARRVIGGKIEPFEVVVFGIDVGAELNGKAHPYEDGDDPVHHLGDRVGLAKEGAAAWESDVEALLLEGGVSLLGFEAGQAIVAVGDEFIAKRVDHLAEAGALICVAVAQLGHEGLDGPLFAQILDLEVLQRLQ